MGRRLLVPLTALLGVLALARPGWAPPPPRPPAPRPVAPPVRPPTAPPRAPGSAPRPPFSGSRPPAGGYAAPGIAASVEAARRRSAAEAAELLRQQNAAALSRAHRAALLNAITHDLLRQQQAASLAELRKLRADWVAVGPGAGLDPVIAMQLEAAEGAAERLLLAEVLKLVAAGQFADALARFEPLESPRYLPAVVVRALPELRGELRRAVPLVRTRAALEAGAMYGAVVAPLAALSDAEKPHALAAAGAAWRPLVFARATFGEAGLGAKLDFVRDTLVSVEKQHGAALARQLRVELAARYFLAGRTADATALVGDGVDPVTASAVLADLRTATLGGGALKNPQISTVIAADRTQPPVYSVVVLTPERLAQWRPAVPNNETSVVEVAETAARGKFKAAVDSEVLAAAGRVNGAVGRIRAALEAEAAPQKAFLGKVEAAHGKPFATPAERALALVAGTRGLTVAEAVGVLAADADRPAAAGRLVATVPAFAHVGGFAAAVELSGQAPVGFAPHPDAGFKLPPGRDRARIRDAVGAALHAQAGKVIAGRPGPDLDRPAFEADARGRLKLPDGDALTAAECVQGLLDVCRDWADERAGLVEALGDLNEAVADIAAGEYGEEDDELKELTQKVKLRRLAVQTDKKRREVGLATGCRLLAAYGPDAAPARDWLRAQTAGGDTPWREEATAALEKLGAK